MNLCKCNKKIEKRTRYHTVLFRVAPQNKGYWQLQLSDGRIKVWDEAAGDDKDLKTLAKYYKNRRPELLERRFKKGLIQCVECKESIVSIERFWQLALLNQFSSDLTEDFIRWLEVLSENSSLEKDYT